MSYTIEDVNGCTKKFLFSFETVDLSDEIESALKKKQKEANLKGFRKGKAPIGVVQQLYGKQAENDALYSFVSTQFFDALKKEDLKAIGYPMFDNTKYDKPESKVSFEAVIEIFPEFEIKPYDNYKFEKESVEVTEDDVNELRDRYLQSKSEMVEIKDATLENGHFAVLNFEGEKEDGSKPENMKGSEFLLEIGSGQFIPGFEEGMVGMKAGENKTLELAFPADYHMEDLQNSKVKFEVELLEIKEKKLPEFTEELAKEFGFDSVEDFMTKQKETLVTQKERQSKEKLNQEILEKFVEDNPFDVPSALINQQKGSVKEELSHNLKYQGFNDEMVEDYFSKWDDDITKRAEFQVRSGLILDKLGNSFDIETTDEDLTAKISEMAMSSGMETSQVEDFYLKNEKLKTNLMYAIREEKTFEKLIASMKVS